MEKLQAKIQNSLDSIDKNREPTVEEIVTFEETLKELFNLKRQGLSDLLAIRKTETLSPEDESILKCYLKRMKRDLLNFCLDIVDMIDQRVLPNIKSAHGRVFFLKIKGDFFRYSAEFLKKGEGHFNRIFQEGVKAYESAHQIAIAELPCESLVHLNLCLNYSVFYYKIAENTLKACEIILQTLYKLNHEMDAIPEEIQKIIQPTKCLLENNLMLWASEIKEKKYSH